MGEGIISIIKARNIHSVEERWVRLRNPKDYYHEQSKRLRKEALEIADKLKNNPLEFHISKGIDMDVEITKSDIKTVVGKNTPDNKFNAIKNVYAKDIEGFLSKSTYEGWRNTIEGKHAEAAYFAYYSRSLNEKAYLCMRKMKTTGKFKPYAIINQAEFDKEAKNIHKTQPPM